MAWIASSEKYVTATRIRIASCNKILFNNVINIIIWIRGELRLQVKVKLNKLKG